MESPCNNSHYYLCTIGFSLSQRLTTFLGLGFLLLLLSGLTTSSGYAAEKTVAQPNNPTILVVGDSLSAAFGMEQSKGWVSLLQKKLQTNNYPHKVINASISGETTQGGLTRLGLLLESYKPEVVLLELGANDGLRGLPLQLMQDNLDKMIRAVKDKGGKVFLIGMQLPPNYGINYTNGFIKVYRDLANKHQIALVPFIMDGFAANLDMIQADGLHPKAEAQPLMLENVWSQLVDLMAD